MIDYVANVLLGLRRAPGSKDEFILLKSPKQNEDAALTGTPSKLLTSVANPPIERRSQGGEQIAVLRISPTKAVLGLPSR